MSASDGGRDPQLGDFPAVFLSYDEPWADANWRALRAILPGAVRVHGVKGLDACHKAAAEAVPGDWVVTVDADTRIAPALARAPVLRRFLTGDFRLDWPARNAVNGLWTGNGCVKLWPKALLSEMRTHEAAPEGTLSLDHDIGTIRPGRSAQVTMPERAAVTEPAQTAFHAFRAGLREAVFLRHTAVASARPEAGPNPAGGRTSTMPLARLLAIWCSVGRHAPNGHWLLYGARLGLALPQLLPGWNPALVNDHDAVAALWTAQVMPRYLRGSPADPGWNWEALEAGLHALRAEAERATGLALAEFGPDASRHLAGCDGLLPAVTSSRLDALGYRLMQSSQTAEGDEAAREILETAVALDHPAAFDNLGRLHAQGRIPGADRARAAWLFRAAEALGNPYAAAHLAELGAGPPAPPALPARDLPLIRAGRGGRAALLRDLRACDAPLCLLFDAGVTPAPAMATHLPDPDLATGDRVVGYLSLCPVSGLPRQGGVRLGSPRHLAAHPDAMPDVLLPVVLGILPAPADAAAALKAGIGAAAGEVPPALLTLGRDADFGGHRALVEVLSRAGAPPDGEGLRRLAALDGDALDDAIAAAARALARHLGVEVPVWTAAESRAIRDVLPPLPARAHWMAAAAAFDALEPSASGRAATMRATARALWGDPPAL